MLYQSWGLNLDVVLLEGIARHPEPDDQLYLGAGYETCQRHRFQWLFPWPAKSAWEFGGTLHGKLQGISSMNVLGYTPLRNNICRALVMLPPYGRGRRHPWRRQVALS